MNADHDPTHDQLDDPAIEPARPIVDPSAGAADLVVWDGAEIATARRYADASRAASTQRAYASDWRRFAQWCAVRHVETLPADPRVVAVFLAAEAELGAAPMTVGRRLAAIGWMHRRAGLQPPQAREGAAAILEVVAGIRRSHGGAPGPQAGRRRRRAARPAPGHRGQRRARGA